MSTGTAKILYVKNELLTANSKRIHKHQQFQLQGKQNTTLILRYLLTEPAGPYAGLTLRFQVAWDMHHT